MLLVWSLQGWRAVALALVKTKMSSASIFHEILVIGLSIQPLVLEA